MLALSPYLTHPPYVNQGLVLYLDANNTNSYSGSGTTWYDLSGEGNNATLLNGVEYSNDNIGSLSFDGTDKYVTVPYSSSWRLSGDFSLEAWIYRTANWTGSLWWRDAIMGHSDGPSETNKWIFSYDIEQLRFLLHTGVAGSGSQFIYSPIQSVLTNFVWYNIVITKKENIYTFYQNTTSLGAVTNSATFPLPSAFLRIANAEEVGMFKGNISIVRIYNRALSASQISANFFSTNLSQLTV